ncbi:MAG: hypothetical protein AB7V46_21260 [Thermomicrobiales bacterium]
MKRLLGIAIGLLALAGSVEAAEPATEEQTGLSVGEQAPGFKLMDQSGEERELSVLLKQGPVALVFYRSASW